jgi:hypothetical protein
MSGPAAFESVIPFLRRYDWNASSHRERDSPHRLFAWSQTACASTYGTVYSWQLDTLLVHPLQRSKAGMYGCANHIDAEAIAQVAWSLGRES